MMIEKESNGILKANVVYHIEFMGKYLYELGQRGIIADQARMDICVKLGEIHRLFNQEYDERTKQQE